MSRKLSPSKEPSAAARDRHSSHEEKGLLENHANALVSFAVGIASATIWISKRRPVVPPVASANNCTPVYDATFVSKRIDANDDPQLFAAFQEPPLYAMPDCVDEAYSLTWIPSFHPPVLVRLWRAGNRSFMVAKELDTKGWSKFGSIKETNSPAVLYKLSTSSTICNVCTRVLLCSFVTVEKQKARESAS